MTPLIVANWKMHKTIAETAEYLKTLKQQNLPADKEVVICPTFTALTTLKESGFSYGAQNIHWEEAGAYTGEVSAAMIADLGCSYAIIGHSERRQYFGETDDIVAKKVTVALAHNIIPIVCVRSVEEVTPALLNRPIVIAYEPVWAIGTGTAATPEQAQTVHAEIRKLVGPEIRIIYGGSVTPENTSALMAQTDVNGVLVGGASLDASNFAKIVNY